MKELKEIIERHRHKSIGFIIFCAVYSLVTFSTIIHNWNQVTTDRAAGMTINSYPEDWESMMVVGLMRQFTEDAKARGVNVDLSNITFSFKSDLMANADENTKEGEIVLATCNSWAKHIYFLKSNITQDNLFDFRSTLYHELAHCAFDMDHDESDPGVNVIMRATHDVDWQEIIQLSGNDPWAEAVDYLFDQIKKRLN